MRYDFGKVYKEIRESKGLTQERDLVGVFSQEPAYQKSKAVRQLQNMKIWNFFSVKSI